MLTCTKGILEQFMFQRQGIWGKTQDIDQINSVFLHKYKCAIKTNLLAN